MPTSLSNQGRINITTVCLKTCLPVIVIVICLALRVPTAMAELKIDSVYPTLGETGQDLIVSISGEALDADTRLSMSLDTGNAAAVIGYKEMPGRTLRLDMEDDLLFVADPDNGLHIVDVSTPATPAVRATLEVSGGVMDVCVEGGYAFVAGWAGTFYVIDITAPDDPFVKASLELPGRALSVALSEGWALVTYGSGLSEPSEFEEGSGGGLTLLDIRDPATPELAGTLDIPGAAVWDVAVSGDTAIVAAGPLGLKMIDIGSDGALSIIAAVDSVPFALGVAVSGSMVAVANGYNGLVMVDISTPGEPLRRGDVATPGRSFAVRVSGQTAYLGSGNGGLQVVDIADPDRPTIMGAASTPIHVTDLIVDDSNAFLADCYSGLQIVDMDRLGAIPSIGAVETQGNATGLDLANGFAVVAAGETGLGMIDISDPTAPFMTDSVETNGEAFDVAVSGDYAFVADGGGLTVVDIRDPFALAVVGSVAVPGWGRRITLTGGHAFVADPETGLQIIDISDPAHPEIVGSVGEAAVQAAISGNLALVVDGHDSLTIVDISDPAHPGIISETTIDGNEPYGVAVVGDKAYVGAGWRLIAVDISDPGHPAELGDVDIYGSTFDIFIDGPMAYVAAGPFGIQMVDIADPESPTLIGTVDTQDNAYGVTISGPMAVVADGTGMVIVPIPVEITTLAVTEGTIMTATLPAPLIDGNYNLRVFNAWESDERSGAVTFLETVDFEPISEMKAIIVAGGGDYAGNSLYASTCLVANQAYKTLISQGYTKENIYYLGDHSVDLFPDDDIANDVDASATSANLQYAINTWAADASELLLYMTDHGKQGTFQLSADEPYFKAEQLDAWLDSLQATMTGQVVCVYDACNSGSFIPLLTPPAGAERIVITSAKADEAAWFMNQGVNSFSYQFWASTWLKGSLYDAFVDAKNMMAFDQTALLDADGDGVASTKEDMAIAGPIPIGRGRSAASLPPSIMAVSDDQTINGPAQVTLWADLGTDALATIDTVWAVVVPPDLGDSATDIPVTDLTSVDLTDTDGDGKYEGQYSGFTQKGVYQVIVYAKDKDDLYSLPASFSVDQRQGSSTGPDADGGYDITSELWAKAVLDVSGSPVTLVWKLVGADITPSGDQVISGYFYADPDDFAYGSVYNPELFVKIYIATNGWCNMAFNHVTVDDVSVYSMGGEASQSSTATLNTRLVEHQYSGVAIETSLQTTGETAASSTGEGYTLSSGLWARAVLQPSTGDVNLIWKQVGTDTTPSGDTVVSGYFYASPEDFPYGSLYNPEVFVKVYIAANGWANMAFNHVTVDTVAIASARDADGTDGQSATASLGNRLVEHAYTGVSLP